MNARKLILLGIAAVLAIGTALFARQWLASQRVATAQPVPVVREEQGPMVLVARVDLPVGAFVKVEDLRWQAWPRESIAPTYLLQDKRKPEEFAGAVVRARIIAGEPILDGRLVKPQDRGFMAAVLTPGLRAVSVPINSSTGISGFVFPGDRVDLILTHTVKQKNGEDNVDRRASETVLTDLRVLAIDQRVQDKNGEPLIGKTVTFEVTAKQAEVIAVADELGKLSLALRSLGKTDEELAAGEQPAALPASLRREQTHTWDAEASRVVRTSNTRSVQVIRGGKAQEVDVPK